MDKQVIIDLDGNLHDGVAITLEIAEIGNVPLSYPVLQSRAKGKLPPAPEIIAQYQQWRSLYGSLALLFRLGKRLNPISHGSKTDVIKACQTSAHQLLATLNTWLASDGFRNLREQFLEKLSSTDSIRLILQTEDPLLRRLPWQGWDVLQRYSGSEVTLSASVYERLPVRLSSRTQVRILAVLGDRCGIDIERDRQLLGHLDGAETVFLVEPSRQVLQQRLWEPEGWDILFFAGHSASDAAAEAGQIALNASDCLSPDELNYALRKAISQGLQLAIFNSCDGLGLARQLEPLQIPQVIVMREPVPDPVAHAFLTHLLIHFADGQPLHLAVRDAREQLQAFEQTCPGATWLPMLCQNPTAPPLTWQALVQPPSLAPLCPYQGLAAFQEVDAPFFFGRESLIQKLMDTVHQQPLVTLIGPSGSGKSSLVFAGLLPQLRPHWHILSLRPDSDPWLSFAEAIASILPPEGQPLNGLAADLHHGTTTLSHCLSHLPNSGRLLLVIDQFEELYTLCPAQERQAYLDQLLAAVHQVPRLTLIVALRADFCEQALAYRPWAAALQQYPPELLGPMTRTELQAAVEIPAIAQGVHFEAGLIERILDSVEVAPGSLPLLEFTLTLLWEHQEAGYLTHAAYDAMGGVAQALARYAEQVYHRLSSQAQHQAQRILTQLVRPGEGMADTRRLATRTELSEHHWAVVQQLVDARLLVSHPDPVSGEDRVEITHEALIQRWQRLQQWLEADRQFRTWQEHLRIVVRQWQVTHPDRGALLRGVPLLVAERWLQERSSDLSETERQFIQTSLALRAQEQLQRQRDRRKKQWFSAAGAILALGLMGVTSWQWQRVYRVETNAQLNARSAASIELLNAGKGLEALLAILPIRQQRDKLIRLDPATQIKAITTLQQVVYRIREFNRFEGHSSSAIAVSFSPDGQRLASVGDDHTVRLWQRDGRLLATLTGHRDRVRSVSFSPDGQLLATASFDGTVRVWRQDGMLLTVLPHGHRLNSVSFSPDGSRLAVAASHGEVVLWQRDLTNPQLTFRLERSLSGHWGWVMAARFSPGGEHLATAATDGTVKLWHVDGTLISTLTGPKTSINSISFSPDRQQLVAASNDGKLWVWQRQGDQFNPEPTQSWQAHPQRIWSVSFSPDGQSLATASADHTIRLWQQDGTLITSLEGHSSSIFSVSYSPDGTLLASASADQTVRLWHTTNPNVRVLRGHAAPIVAIRFHSGGQVLATASEDGEVQVWQPNEVRRTSFLAHASGLLSLDFSPDGQTLATAGLDATVKLWTLEGRSIQTLMVNIVPSDVMFSPDGRSLVAAGQDGIIHLWHRNAAGQFPERPSQTLRGHRRWVNAIDFSPDGQTLATASADNTVLLWQRNVMGEYYARPNQVLQGHTSRVTDVGFNSDGQILATASADGTVKLWRKEGTLLNTLTGHNAEVRSIVFSPSGQMLASATTDGQIKLWDLQGNLLKGWRAHTTGITGLSLSPDGQTLASASLDQTAILWSLDVDLLTEQGCRWVQDYLNTNRSLSDRDRQICN